ncbi:hypothetical protein D6817_05780 [Candidatus Pacearchaeota archaeon]|nr:MAG: hypothetical protein D6817_05780 [Candidatus Pacearchaeota archaeon]
MEIYILFTAIICLCLGLALWWAVGKLSLLETRKNKLVEHALWALVVLLSILGTLLVGAGLVMLIPFLTLGFFGVLFFIMVTMVVLIILWKIVLNTAENLERK